MSLYCYRYGRGGCGGGRGGSARTLATVTATRGEDFYKIMGVPYNATADEIKSSYRKLAMKLHPDTHGGPEDRCDKKTDMFKRVNEAYDVLSDAEKKIQYDYEIGNYDGAGAGAGANGARAYWQKKRHPRAASYRTVYRPNAPPDWDKLWDHRMHYDMHYGTGMRREALRQAKREAIKNGDFDYVSPLGRGFAFSNPDDDADKNNGDGNINRNPYSKYAPQGPPEVVFDYEEGYTDMTTGKQHVQRKERIVEDLYRRRSRRVYAAAYGGGEPHVNGVNGAADNGGGGLQRDFHGSRGRGGRSPPSPTPTTLFAADHLNKDGAECVIL